MKELGDVVEEWELLLLLFIILFEEYSPFDQEVLFVLTLSPMIFGFVMKFWLAGPELTEEEEYWRMEPFVDIEEDVGLPVE